MTAALDTRGRTPRCETCGEPLLFVENVKTGAKLPLVRKPISNVRRDLLRPGMVVVSSSRRKGSVLTLEVIGTTDDRAAVLDKAIEEERIHVSHFTSPACARAQERKRGGS